MLFRAFLAFAGAHRDRYREAIGERTENDRHSRDGEQLDEETRGHIDLVSFVAQRLSSLSFVQGEKRAALYKFMEDFRGHVIFSGVHVIYSGVHSSPTTRATRQENFRFRMKLPCTGLSHGV